jgi:serine/threonine protein kinase
MRNAACTILAGEKFSRSAAAGILLKTIHVLERVNDAEMSYAGLSPEHVFIGENAVSLISPVLNQVPAGYSSYEDHFTTPFYAAPEVCLGTVCDPLAASLYPAGMLYYSLLFGKVPFETEGAFRLFEAKEKGDPLISFGEFGNSFSDPAPEPAEVFGILTSASGDTRIKNLEQVKQILKRETVSETASPR